MTITDLHTGEVYSIWEFIKIHPIITFFTLFISCLISWFFIRCNKVIDKILNK